MRRILPRYRINDIDSLHQDGRVFGRDKKLSVGEKRKNQKRKKITACIWAVNEVVAKSV